MTWRAWFSHAGGDFLRDLGRGKDGKGSGEEGDEGTERVGGGEGRWRRIKARMWIEAIVDLCDVRNVDGQ